MYVSKWYSYAAAGCLQLCAGLAYTFSLYSGAVKQSLHFTQPQLEGLGSALLSGGLFAILPGLLYDALSSHHHLGPRLTATIGLLCHSVGYSGVWLIASSRIVLPYWLLIAFGLLASSGLLWLDTAAIITCLRNAPTYRGDVAGSLKTFLGLSASIAATIYAGAFTDGLSFLLFLALGPPALGLLMLPLLNHVPYVEDCELDSSAHKPVTGGRFLAIYCAIGLLLLYQLATALVGQLHPLDAVWRLWIMIGALILLAITLLVPISSVGSIVSRPASLPCHTGLATGGLDTSPLLSAGCATDVEGAAADQATDNSEGAVGNKDVASMSPRDWSLRQCLASADFWFLFSGFAINVGAGFVYLSNLGQHVESLGGHAGSQAIHVLIFTSFSCAGRMVCGFGSEWLLHRGHARTVVLVGASATTALIYLAVGFAGLRLLIPCSIIAGFAFGAHWSLMPVLTSDIFGLQHFASNQSIMHMSTAIGGFILSSQLAGRLYAYEGHAHSDTPGTCIGHSCFRVTFLIIAAIAAAQTLAATAIHRRTRGIYAELYQRLHQYDEGQNL